MKLSTKGTYGLRAMVDIAYNQQFGLVSLKDISQREDISIKYLEKLMNTLKKEGFVISMRGSRGGYKLSASPDTISIGSILRALEGNLYPVDCKALIEDGCIIEEDCVMKCVWNRINMAINNAVDTLYLSDLIRNVSCESDIKGCNL